MNFFQSWMEICEKRDKITKKMPKSKGFPFSCLLYTSSDAKHIIPMHMWDQYDIVEKLCKRDEVKAYAKRIQKIRKDMETFTI